MVTRYTDPVGRETLYEYDTNEIDLVNVKQKNPQSPGGYDLLTTYTYNSNHQPLTVTDAAGQTTTYTYNTEGQIATVTTPERDGITEDRATTYTYDEDGYLESVEGPLDATASYTYDSYGRTRTVTDPDGYVLTYDYDVLDRPTRVTYPDSTYKERVYVRLDNVGVRDRLGRWEHAAFDPVGRLTTTTDALGRTTTRHWCSCGTLDSLVDPNDNKTTWGRDIQGRVTKKIGSNSSEWTYVYEDATSRFKSITDPKAQVKMYAYFLDDNLKSINYSNEEHDTANVSFTFDDTYFRLKTMTDGTGTTVYTYNPAGVAGALQLGTVDGPLSNDSITYDYDELGRVVSRSINGAALAYEYDALGRIATENNLLGSFSYEYDDVTNRVESVIYPNGQVSSYSYYSNSGDHRLEEIHHKKADTSTISKFNYSYNAVGNITTWTQQRDTNPANAYDFDYDQADQLRNAVWRTTDATPTILERFGYVYDSAGNRTVEQIDNAPALSAYDNMNRLTSQSPGGTMRFAGSLSEAATVTIQGAPATVTSNNDFAGGAEVPSGTSQVVVKAKDYTGNERTNTYEVSTSGGSKTFTFDANGNMTGDGTRTFQWDAENRLITYAEGNVDISFEYDGRGRRTRLTKEVEESTVKDVRFLWCGDEMCEERDNSGANVVRRLFEHGYWDTTGAHFFTRDHLRNVREVVDPSQSIEDRYDYDSYGRVTVDFSSTDNTTRFTGHYLEETSGLVLTLYRAYDPDLGQWLSEDPVEHRDGLSLYGYVLGNPIKYYDSLGLFAQQPGGPPECGGPCPHWVMTEYFNACDAEQDNPDSWISRCMKEKCKWTGNVRKEVRITCGQRSTNSECASGQPGYTPLSDSIVICPENGNNAPCWRRVMVHEIVVHACRPGGPGVPPESHDRDLSPHIRRNVDCPMAGVQ